MKTEVKVRLKWVTPDNETNNAGLVCLLCGVSRPTLRKWQKRYKSLGVDGLQEKSNRGTQISYSWSENTKKARC